MKYGFLLTDCNGNKYRAIASSLFSAIDKVALEHNLDKSDITSVCRGNSISSTGL